MWQYYRASIRNWLKVKYFSTYDFDNWAKLMEHSYVWNRYVNAVMIELFNNPWRVYWMWDYWNDVLEEQLQFNDKAMWAQYVYDRVWHTKINNEKCWDIVWQIVCAEKINNEAEALKFDLNKCFIVFHDHKTIIDMSQYETNNYATNSFVIHPLPLLTAVWNGQWGWDYSWPNEDAVWIFAWDHVTIENEPRQILNLISKEWYVIENFTFKED